MRRWWHSHHSDRELLEGILATLADLDTAIAELKTSVDTLIAQEPVPPDVQPQVDAVNAIKAEVDAAVTPPPPPAP